MLAGYASAHVVRMMGNSRTIGNLPAHSRRYGYGALKSVRVYPNAILPVYTYLEAAQEGDSDCSQPPRTMVPSRSDRWWAIELRQLWLHQGRA
jgi:hypothetical protein